MLTPNYIHLKATSSPLKFELKSPFATIVVIDTLVSPSWRQKVSEWLVEKGCLYMMAHGDQCSLWDDSVDTATLEAFNWKRIPDDKLVATTWHDDESLEEVFYFALNTLPFYPLIKNIVILDITNSSREEELLRRFKSAQDEFDEDKTAHVSESLNTSERDMIILLGIIVSALALVVLWFLFLK